MNYKGKNKKGEAEKPKEPELDDNAGGKWNELYKLAEKKKSRTNRPNDEIELEKQQDEFTFKPKISKKSLKISSSPRTQKNKPQLKASTDTGLSSARGGARRQQQLNNKDVLLSVDINLGE